MVNENHYINIQSFKHNGKLHRTWFDAFILEKTNSMYVLITNKAVVMDYNGRRWITKEPAVCFLFPDRWYNVIAMIRKNGIHYYCNIASPSVFDEEALKNIDYDLDVKVDQNYQLHILDEYEYHEHIIEMNYSEELQTIIEHSLQEVITAIQKREPIFQHNVVMNYYKKYLEVKKDVSTK